jgi:hypothetical protein
MESGESVFDRTYADYLARLGGLNLQGLEDILGVRVDGDEVIVPLLINDRDEEFEASCSVLFEMRAKRYLDPESPATLGRLLFTCLKRWGKA